MPKYFIFLFFLILISGSFVVATSFSPVSLIFELNPNEEECKMITLSSDSETIMVSDKWAENKDVDWKVSLFETSASEHGITINYPEELSEEREIEVCIKGERAGEYHGVILLRELQQGNSIIQMGVWVKLTIEAQTPASPQTSVDNSPPANNGGGSGQVVLGIENETEEDVEEIKVGSEDEKRLLRESQEENEEGSGMTGWVIGENSIGGGTIIAIIFILAIVGFAIGIAIYRRRKI